MKQFKLLGYLLVAVLCLGFASCSDDDPVFDEVDIVGEWYVSRSEGYYHDEDGNKKEFLDNYSRGEIEYTFYEGGTGNEWDNENKELSEFSWTLKNGNRLVIDFDHVTGLVDLKIVSLTEATAVLEDSGTDEDGKYFIKRTLKRIN